ncbi:DNA polymerase III subunit alpha [Candidatus Saccharibacteria bacterium]|nr:DNA polymerase III subunit alpha [Candidatus Saccharibacteria bacterium]
MSKGELKPSDFVHLHNHTHYSVLDGLTKIPDLVDTVKELGMEAVAITDHGTMSGVLELYQVCLEQGVKPILGCEFYVAARSMEDRDPQKDKERFHLTLLAENYEGYQNLCRLITEANLRGFYYKPRIDYQTLEKYNAGIICLSGCASSEISENINADAYPVARDLAERHKKIFGDRFFLEMQDHGHPDAPCFWEKQQKVNKGLQKLSKELDIPLVVTCDGHYVHLDDQNAHEILLAVGTADLISNPDRMSLKEFQLHVIDPKDIIARWGKDFPEAITNTKKIADRCSLSIELGRVLIPEFPCPDGKTEKEYLRELVLAGAAKRYGNNYTKNPAIIERLEYELGTIAAMDFYGYFLIVQDFINWGKNQGIIFGPGRGSAAGSIIAYCLNITDLDPLKYGLLFERFLNPDRISMPDIDIDIQDTRRDEVIDYCTKKYGSERVANICTFGKMMAKNAVRDVARVLSVPYQDADRLAKLVPDPIQGRHTPLKTSLKESQDLKAEYESNPQAKTVIDYAAHLEGTIRNHGVHACGVVIAPDDLIKFMPLEIAQKGVVATQFPMGQVEDLGLLKMDFLGLKNLSILNSALRIIKKVYKKEINLSDIPLDDAKTFELFKAADTTGVFQLESSGMKRYLKGLQASHFEDIIAMVALYRPGPMQFIDSFINRKHGIEPITYLHPGLESALETTYGVLVYQEQFMQIAKEWCGFTGGEADTLRKAVGKKKMSLMREMKSRFIDGAVKIGGSSAELAEKFWNDLEEFANYCFNKSHAACYALIAYWTAYVKAHYPDAFMAALMTADADDTDRLAIEIAECKKMGLKVQSPNINQSYNEFAIVPGKNTIRFALSAVKGVGHGLVEELCEDRKENGPFLSISDFARRAPLKFSKKAWEALIKTGAFEEFGTRSDLLFNVDRISEYTITARKDALSNQMGLFSDMTTITPDIELIPAPTIATEREQLQWERELIGLYISAHPLDSAADYLDEQTLPLGDLTENSHGLSGQFGGSIASVKTIITKKGDKMAFLQVEDLTGEVEVIIFPKIFQLYGHMLESDAIIQITGTIETHDQNNRPTDIKLIASEILTLNESLFTNYKKTGKRITAKTKGRTPINPRASTPPSAKTIYIKVDSPTDHLIAKVKAITEKYPGSDAVTFVAVCDGKKQGIQLPNPTSAEKCQPELASLVPVSNLVVR